MGTGNVSVAAGIQLQIGGTGLTVPNNVTLNGLTTGGAFVGGVDTGAVSNTFSGTLTLAQTSNVSTYWSDKTLTIAGKVTGPGGLVIDRVASGNNSPNIVLSNTGNDYAGGTTVNNATLLAFSSLGSGNLTVNSSTTLRWNSGTTLDISPKLQAIPTGQTVTLDTNGNNVSFANPVNATGSGTIAKSGAGTLALASTAGYTGATTINAGTLSTPTLADSGNSGIGTGAVVVAGGTLQYTGRGRGDDVPRGHRQHRQRRRHRREQRGRQPRHQHRPHRQRRLGPEQVRGRHAHPVGHDRQRLPDTQAQAGTVQLNKSVSGGPRAVAGINNILPGATVKLIGSNGDQIFGGAYTATTVNYGLVNMTGGTLDLNGKSESIDRLTGTGTVTNNAAAGTTSTLTVGESNGVGPTGNVTTYGGAISDGASGGKVALNKVGTGTVVLNGAHNYTGGTTVAGGTLRINPGVPVQGAALWLDASNTSSITTNAGNVATWGDLSGNNRNGAQGTAAAQPVYTTNAAGKNVVRFAAGQVLPVNLSFLNGSPYTIFAIEAKASAAPSTSFYFLGTQTAATNQGLHFGYRTDTDFALAQYGNDLDYTSAPAFTSPTFREWTGRLDTTAGGGHAIFLNGMPVASNTNLTPLTSPGQGVIGQGFQASTQYLGDLGEIIIFPSALSAAQRRRSTRTSRPSGSATAPSPTSCRPARPWP